MEGVIITPQITDQQIHVTNAGSYRRFYLDFQVKVVDWMKGQTCGICGMADGETRQDFRTPSGFVSENPVASAHSWILPADSCKGASGEEGERSQQLPRVARAPDPKGKLNRSFPSIRRVPNQAGIHRAGEAGGDLRPGIQMLLRSARAALPVRLLPREDRPHHRGLPLRGRW